MQRVEDEVDHCGQDDTLVLATTILDRAVLRAHNEAPSGHSSP